MDPFGENILLPGSPIYTFEISNRNDNIYLIGFNTYGTAEPRINVCSPLLSCHSSPPFTTNIARKVVTPEWTEDDWTYHQDKFRQEY
jgi:hypothetical protein